MRQAGTLSRFATVGVAVAGVYVLLYLAFQKTGLARMPANALAFAGAVILQYAAQARFTYRRRLADPPQIARFGLMVGGGFVTSALITGLIAPRLGLADGIAALAVALVLPVQNFILMTLWVFSSHHLHRGDAR